MRSLPKEATSFGNVFPHTNLYLAGMRTCVSLTRTQRRYSISYHTRTEGITCRNSKARYIYACIASNETSCTQETEQAIRILEIIARGNANIIYGPALFIVYSLT